MKSAILLAFLLVSPAIAEEAGYPFDMPAQNPAAISAWHKIVPKRFQREDWIFNFQGVASPTRAITLSGKPYLFGDVCKPHDCGDNQVAFLVAVDGSRAVAVTRFAGKPGPNFGTPTDTETTMMQRKMDNPNADPLPAGTH